MPLQRWAAAWAAATEVKARLKAVATLAVFHGCRALWPCFPALRTRLDTLYIVCCVGAV